MTRRYGSMKRRASLKHTAKHIRETLGTEEELRQLGTSYVNRPANPIICLSNREVFEATAGWQA